MAKLFENEAKKLIAENNIEEVRLCLLARMDKAGLEYLSDGKDKIFELLIEIRDNFDETEYMQGKKDGLRTALALLGTDHMLELNRGGAMARPTKCAVDEGDSTPLQAESTPEVLSIEEVGTTPTLRN